MKKRFSGAVAIGLVFCVMVFFSMASPAIAKPLPKTIVFGANTPGSLFYVMAAGLAKVISAHSPMKVEIFPQGGTVWYPMLEAGEVDFGINVPGDILTAYRGEGLSLEDAHARKSPHGWTSGAG